MTKTKEQVENHARNYLNSLRKTVKADKALSASLKLSIANLEERVLIHEGLIRVVEAALEKGVCLNCGQPIGWQETVSLFQSARVGEA